MKRIALSVTLAAAALALSPTELLVVANPSSPFSVAIADRYAKLRGVPQENLLTLPYGTPTSETITRDVFEVYVWYPIRTFLEEEDPGGHIKCIVLTKGVPLRIAEQDSSNDSLYSPMSYDRASVDSELTLVWESGHPLGGPMENPYYGADEPFGGFSGSPRILLVARLTGYEMDADADGLPDDVEKLMRGSLEERREGALFVLDEDPTKASGYAIGNIWLANAASLLVSAGVGVLHDETTTFVSGVEPIAGYASWGSNDANRPPAPYYTPGVPGVFAPGSLTTDYVSSSGRTFTWGASGPYYGQSLLADLIHLGACGGQGHVFEPYLEACARPDVLFPRYVAGYSAVESYWMATRFVSWQEVVVCDPLMSYSGEGAGTVQTTLGAGWHLLALPLEPDDPRAEVVLAPLGPGLMGRLFTYDPAVGYLSYPGFAEMHAGTGYWVRLFEPATICVQGLPVPRGVPVTLRRGQNLVGYYRQEPMPLSAVKVRVGRVEYSFADAVGMGLVKGQLYGYDAGRYQRVELPGGVLDPWRAYWVEALTGGVALVF